MLPCSNVFCSPLNSAEWCLSSPSKSLRSSRISRSLSLITCPFDVFISLKGTKVTATCWTLKRCSHFEFFLTFSKYLNLLEQRRIPYLSEPLALSISLSSSRSMQLFVWFSSAFPPLNLSVEKSKQNKKKQSSKVHIVPAFRPQVVQCWQFKSNIKLVCVIEKN